MATSCSLFHPLVCISLPTIFDLVNDKPHYAGHRQRLRQRFLKSEPDALPDYELLEMLLFMTNTRSDVKPLAKSLLARFGSLAEVISADPAALREIKGIGDTKHHHFQGCPGGGAQAGPRQSDEETGAIVLAGADGLLPCQHGL